MSTKSGTRGKSLPPEFRQAEDEEKLAAFMREYIDPLFTPENIGRTIFEMVRCGMLTHNMYGVRLTVKR